MDHNVSTPQAQPALTTLAESALQARLREKLNVEGVRLWQKPFYDDSTFTVCDTEIMALASRYATDMELQESDVVEALLSLQRNAIERLTERDLYKNTGMATLRLKNSNVQKNQKLQVNLGITGKELKEVVAQTMELPEDKIKLISSGKVIVEERTLDTQGIKNGGGILVVVVANEASVGESVFKDLEEIKASADYLAGKDIDGHYSLQVADQTGKALDLPDSEKKAIAVSLALHDKGRAALKQKDYSKALVFLLEAENIYSTCQSQLLEMVDNFGMLNLDIAWCYLCLQSISDLPAVENRLNKSEKALHKSYGENFERVIALKGSTGAESALFVRLHLLQGIAAYHLGQNDKSKFYIRKVDAEISRLQIKDDQLAELINMGYAPGESRMALRATFGDVTASVDLIIRKREEDAKIKEQEHSDAQRRKLQKKLGKCANGELVNVMLYRNLKEMGFNDMLALESLRRTNNDINLALQLVNDDAFITSVVTANMRVLAPGNPSTSTAGQDPSTAGQDPSAAGQEPSTSSALPNLGSNDSLNILMEKLSAQEVEKSLKAMDTISKDMYSESEYIDLSLSDETEFLSQYKELLRI